MSDPVITSLGGNCPVQADGTIDGVPFYFRARGSRWSLSVGEHPVGDPDWFYEEQYDGGDDFAAGWMTEAEALAFIEKGTKLYIKERNNMETDEIVVKELRSVACALADTILLNDLDYEDSVHTLRGVLSTLEYYCCYSDHNEFLNSLPDAVLEVFAEAEDSTSSVDTSFRERDDGIDVACASNSDLAYNLKNLGFKTYMAMAELGFISFEQLITAATVQLNSNGTKAN